MNTDLDSFQAIRLVSAERKILPQRMSLPIIRQQNSPEIRMAVKNHSEQVKRLAFVPIRGAPQTGDARYVNVVLVQHHFNSNAMIFSGREKVIIDFETRFLFNSAIRTANVCEEIKTSFRPRLQKRTCIKEVFARYDKRRLAERNDDFRDPFGMLTL